MEIGSEEGVNFNLEPLGHIGPVLPMQIYDFFILNIFMTAFLAWRVNLKQKNCELSLITLDPSHLINLQPP